jgi:hypothetical protein
MDMTRTQAKIYVAGGIVVAIGGFIVSGPSVPNFWMWMALPAVMFVGGTIRLLCS